MKNILDTLNQDYFPAWVQEEKRQLRIIEESAAGLVTAIKTHPAKKPFIKRMRQAQKDLEVASSQCIACSELSSYLDNNKEVAEQIFNESFYLSLSASTQEKNILDLAQLIKRPKNF